MNMNSRALPRLGAAALAWLSCVGAHAADGSFTTLTYNVAGLPQVLSSAAGDRAAATRLISCYVKNFDIVNVQEDFNYHAELYDSCDNHPYRSPTSGGAAVGSGLNTLSRYRYDDWDRVSWSHCNGVDCLTPKGFTLARTRLAEGVYVDVYNLHTQAQTASADLTARRADIQQLLAYIEAESAGNAVVVMGDTNTRYTRDGDNMWEFLRHGFTDAWVKNVRNGSVPAVGAAAMVCEPAVTSPNCEIVDKIVYRNGAHVTLNATGYNVQVDAKDAGGVELSDHRPVAVNWSYTLASDRRLSDTFGGPHGTSFDDASLLPASPAVRQLKIRAGARVDRVETVLANGYPFGHGGGGGNEQVLTLGNGEVLTRASMCTDSYNGHTRLFSISFSTNWNRGLSGGTPTATCTTYTAPAGWAIVGFHGRSGDGVDKLGMVYAPALPNNGAAVTPMRFVNKQSGLCMDVDRANAADGSNVLQWTCNGGQNQQWSYDATTGLVRSMLDPHYCLDNSGSYDSGANIMLWTCNGNSNQRYTFDTATGRLAVRNNPVQVVDGVAATGNVITYQDWNGANQRWAMRP